MDRFVNSLQHIEALGLTVERKFLQEFHLPVMHSIILLKRLGKECQDINHLELKIPEFPDIRTELIDTIVLPAPYARHGQ